MNYSPTPLPPESATGNVRLLLRLEGLATLCAAVAIYSQSESGWTLFLLCFLAPDLSFLGYLAGPRVGAIAYNCAHSYVGAFIAMVISVYCKSPLLFALGLIWCAHIGFDRALGYGLKYANGFAFTHLGRLRSSSADTPNTITSAHA